MRWFREHLWVAVVWALTPLTFVSGMPRQGCICANGDYKLFCDGHHGCCRHSGAAKSAQESEPCCCCHKSHHESQCDGVSVAKTDSGSDCCHGSSRCPRGVARPQRCCTPVVGMTVLPRLAEQVSAPDFNVQSLLVCVVDVLPSPAGSPIPVSVRSPDLPVPDLVIAHQALLI